MPVQLKTRQEIAEAKLSAAQSETASLADAASSLSAARVESVSASSSVVAGHCPWVCRS